jgi:hypothetical protein
MAIWILQPDQQGNCCACGVRQNPCDMCASGGCIPLEFFQGLDGGIFWPNGTFQGGYQQTTEGFIVNSAPTGIILKSAGVSTAINFTNNNSKLQVVSTPNDIYFPSGSTTRSSASSITTGWNNLISNYIFTFELLLNIGEIVTLYTESLANIVTSYSGQTRQDGYNTFGQLVSSGSFAPLSQCPSFFETILNPKVLSTAYQGQNFLSVVGAPVSGILNSTEAFFILTNADNQLNGNSAVTTTFFPYITYNLISAPNANDPNATKIDCSSLAFSATQPSYPQLPADTVGPSWVQSSTFVPNQCAMDYDSVLSNGFPVIIGEEMINNISVQVIGESFSVVNTIGGVSIPVNCSPLPSSINYKASFQLSGSQTFGYAPTDYNQTGDYMLLSSGSVCSQVVCTNNSYIQLTTANGTPVDLTSRISNLNIVPNGLP